VVDQETQRRLAVFARAALRETQEETGLLLVRADSPPLRPSRSEVWRRYAAAGRAPAFDCLRLLARAITPTDSPIRYHTRFFLCCGAEVTGTIGGDGELEDVGWKSIAETGALDMPGVTRWLLGEALAAAGLEQAPKVQLRTWRGGGPDSAGLLRVVE
jgi:8-oxo-dGTP pyrophosphatase MutT (NUDIX family)